MIQPERAPVRPRILAPESGAALPLEEEIIRLLEEPTAGLIQLVGPPGSGNTTALGPTRPPELPRGLSTLAFRHHGTWT